jgi:hypothetical protein
VVGVTVGDESGPARPTRFGGAVALAVAAVATAALGIIVGAGPRTVVAVVGALLAVVGLDRYAEDELRERALGGVAAGLGVFLVAGALVDSAYLPPPNRAFVVIGAACVLLVGLEGNTRIAGQRRGCAALLRSAAALAVVTVLGAMLSAEAAAVGFLLVRGAFEWVRGLRPLSSILLLQALCLAIALSIPAVARILDGWVGGEGTSIPPVFERVSLDIRDVPPAYALLIVGQVLAAVYLPGLFEWFLRQLWLVGTAARLLLASGIVHAPAIALLSLCCAVFAAWVLRQIVVWFAGNTPRAVAADIAGALVVGLVGAFAYWVLPVEAWMSADVRAAAAVFGPFVVTGALAVALGAGAFVGLVGTWVRAERPLPALGSGFSLGAVGLSVLVVVAAESGASVLAISLGVVAALLVWDAGEYATRLGRDVGSATGTRRAELAHLTGSAIAGLVGAAVATAAAAAIGPISASIGRANGVPALVLLLISLVAFLVLVERTSA